MAHDDEPPSHGRRATDRPMSSTRSMPFRFDWGIGLGQMLIFIPLIITATAYFVNGNAQTEQNKQQMDRLRLDVTAQINDLKKDMTDRFQAQQVAFTASVTALTAVIANVPKIDAALPEMRDRITRTEQEQANFRAQLQTVQAQAVETQAQLKAALQAGIDRQRIR